jgi:hypothetical protein
MLCWVTGGLRALFFTSSLRTGSVFYLKDLAATKRNGDEAALVKPAISWQLYELRASQWLAEELLRQFFFLCARCTSVSRSPGRARHALDRTGQSSQWPNNRSGSKVEHGGPSLHRYHHKFGTKILPREKDPITNYWKEHAYVIRSSRPLINWAVVRCHSPAVALR